MIIKQINFMKMWLAGSHKLLCQESDTFMRQISGNSGSIWQNFGSLLLFLGLALSHSAYSEQIAVRKEPQHQLNVGGDFHFDWIDQLPALNKLEKDPRGNVLNSQSERTFGLTRATLRAEAELLRKSRLFLSLRPLAESAGTKKEYDTRVGEVYDPSPTVHLLDSIGVEFSLGKSLSATTGIFDHLWVPDQIKTEVLEFGLNPRLPRKVQALALKWGVHSSSPPAANDEINTDSNSFEIILYGSERGTDLSSPGEGYGSSPTSSDGRLGIAAVYRHQSLASSQGIIIGNKESLILDSDLTENASGSIGTKQRLFIEGFALLNFPNISYTPKLRIGGVHTQDSFTRMSTNIRNRRQTVGRIDLRTTPLLDQSLLLGSSYGQQVLEDNRERRAYQIDGAYEYSFDPSAVFTLEVAHEMRQEKGENSKDPLFSGSQTGSRVWRLALQLSYYFDVQIR